MVAVKVVRLHCYLPANGMMGKIILPMHKRSESSMKGFVVEYTHHPLSRETFLKQLVKLTGGMASALAVLPLLESNYAVGQTGDVGLLTERLTYPSEKGEMKAYMARPQKKGA